MAEATETAEKQAKRDPRGDPARVAAYRFKPGQTGNPKGRPRKPKPGQNGDGITASPFKHGRNWQVHLPSPYKELYEAALSDPGLLRLERDVSLLDSRLSVLLAEARPSGERWEAVAECQAKIEAALHAHDPAGLQASLDSLREVYEGGRSEQAKWKEIRALLDQRRRTIETLAKQEFLGGKYFKAEEVAEIYRSLAVAVHGAMMKLRDAEGFTVRDALRQVQSDMRRAMGQVPKRLEAGSVVSPEVVASPEAMK